MIRRLDEIAVYANDYARIYDDRVEFASGRVGRYLRIEPATPGRGVVIVALRQGRVALVQTYRYPLGRSQWGLPRGFAQGVDEAATVRAELREELGATATDLARVGILTPDSGMLAHDVAVYTATVDATTAPPTDVDEVEDVRWASPSDLDTAIAAGQIDDGFTLAAWCLYRLAAAHGGGRGTV